MTVSRTVVPSQYVEPESVKPIIDEKPVIANVQPESEPKQVINNSDKPVEKPEASTNAIKQIYDKAQPVKRRLELSKMQIAGIVFGVLIVGLLIYTVICEKKLEEGYDLYKTGHYLDAKDTIKIVPVLNREKVIRIRMAAFVAFDYEMFLKTKKIRINSSGSKDAYREGFKELINGLRFCKLCAESEKYSDIQREECEDIMGLYYKELYSVYGMGKGAAREFLIEYEGMSSYEEERARDKWLDEYFFEE